jgi:hypothetical protein
MTGRFIESGVQIVQAIVPVDLATAANNGDWVSLKNHARVVVLVSADAGTAGEDPVITMRQATDNAGTSAKALNFTAIWEKVGTQTGVATFTKVEQTAANTYTNTVSGEAENLFVLEFRAEELDVANGFDHVQLQVPDTGATAGKMGSALYLLLDPRFGD